MKRMGLKLVSVLFLGVIVLISSMFISVTRSSGLASEKKLTIEKGWGVGEIAGKLKDDKVISNKNLFYVFTLFKGSASQLQSGSYVITPDDSILDIIRLLEKGGRPLDIRLTIPEGLTVSQIEGRLNQASLEFDMNSVDWKELSGKYIVLAEPVAKNGRNFKGEGYLFPDTYLFSKDLSMQEIAEKMVSNLFEKTKEYQNEIEQSGKSLDDIIIIASMIEREVKFDHDRALVSDIIWRRLNEKMPLQIDATIIYLKEELGLAGRSITNSDLGIDSPFNTYKVVGLPPRAISNPGLESIKAAVYPQKNDYWYYLSKSDGTTVYSRTFEEHVRAKRLYLTPQ